MHLNLYQHDIHFLKLFQMVISTMDGHSCDELVAVATRWTYQ